MKGGFILRRLRAVRAWWLRGYRRTHRMCSVCHSRVMSSPNEPAGCNCDVIAYRDPAEYRTRVCAVLRARAAWAERHFKPRPHPDCDEGEAFI